MTRHEIQILRAAGIPQATGRLRGWRWADLLRRAFEVDVLACPRCGGRMRVLATIEDPATVRRILAHVGLATAPVRADPAQPPPEGPIASSEDMFA